MAFKKKQKKRLFTPNHKLGHADNELIPQLNNSAEDRELWC